MREVSRSSIYCMIFFGLIAQMTIVQYVGIFNHKPDIIFILVVFCGLFFGEIRGAEYGAFAGFLVDIFTLDIFPINTLTYGIFGAISGLMAHRVSCESRWSHFFTVFFLSIAVMLAHFLITSFIAKQSLITCRDLLFSSIIPSSLYSALIASWLFSRLIGRYHIRTPEEYI